jgi:hypothetical protein
MRRTTLAILLALTTGGVLSSGCINSHRAAVRQPVVVVPSERIVVTQAPPPMRAEQSGIAPDERHVWIPGYWMHADQRWIWVPGHWETRPRVDATWIPGRWDKETAGKGWVWIPGHWE